MKPGIDLMLQSGVANKGLAQECMNIQETGAFCGGLHK